MEEIRNPVLTLKNIYRIMTRNDFLVPSYPVWRDRGSKSRTLHEFWLDYYTRVLPPETDLSVFTSPAMQRTLSRLMNRNGGSGLLSSWFSDLAAHLNPALLERMTLLWISLLNQHQSNLDSLAKRLEELTRLIVVLEDLGSPDLEQFLSGLVPARQKDPQIPLLFRFAYALSWCTLCALFSTRASDPALMTLRMDQRGSCPSLYRAVMNRSVAEEAVTVISAGVPIASPPLPESEFIGRKDLMSAALKTFQSGCGKLAICGMGGIGKTEFARQLFRRLLLLKQYRQVAFVQYHLSLENSLVSAFPSLGDQGNLRSARQLLEEPGTLLVLDQADSAPDLQVLSSFECDILLTTRSERIEGFTTLSLPGLTAAEGEALFLHHHPGAAGESPFVRKLCSLIAGHPLAIILFARVCHIRFWTVRHLYEQLNAHGLSGIRYVNEGAVLRISDVFAQVYQLARLPREQGQLLTLLSLLPYRFWLPEELLRYAEDISPDREELADLCQILCDLGFLMRGASGYAIHPLISETARVSPVSSKQFPLLWKQLSMDVKALHSPGCRVLLSVFLHTDHPDLDAIRCIAALERSAGFLSFFHIPPEVYEKHRAFLDSRDHPEEDELDWVLSCGMRDILFLSRIDRLDTYIRPFLTLSAESLSSSKTTCLFTLLEYASAGQEKAFIHQAFEALKPAEQDAVRMAEYLVSYSVMQRRMDHDPSAALQSLQRAEKILPFREDDPGLQILFSNLYYRKGVCQLDLNDFESAQKNLAQCLQLLRSRNYPDDSAKVMSTRSTYAVSLWLGKANEKALAEYTDLAEIYRSQKRTESLEYVMMRNNTALLLFDLGRRAEAEDVIKEVLSLDSRLTLAQDISATHFRNAAFILAKNQKWSQAKNSALQAVQLRKAYFGDTSPWTADAEAVYALVLHGLGNTKEAAALIRRACDTLLHSWGPEHRHTKNALQIQKEISGEQFL